MRLLLALGSDDGDFVWLGHRTGTRESIKYCHVKRNDFERRVTRRGKDVLCGDAHALPCAEVASRYSVREVVLRQPISLPLLGCV